MSYSQLVNSVGDVGKVLVSAVLSHPICTLFGCIVLRVLYLLYFHPLANIPGPKVAAVTDLWKTHAVFRKKFSSTLHKEHAKHGDVVRIGPNEVSIVSPDDVTTIYGQRSECLKGPFYQAWAFFGKSHFSDRDPVTHRHGRQKIAGAYSLHHLTSLEPYCDSCTDLLFRQLDRVCDSGSIIDLSKFLELYAYDCVSGIGFGKHFGLLEDGGDLKGMISTMAKANQALVVMATLTNFNWLLSIRPFAWLVSMIMGGKGPELFIQHGARYVTERQVMRERDPMTYEDGKDMLYRFMESKDPATSKPLDDIELIKNCISIIVAGADTTRASMLAFLRYVYAHPQTLQRLRDEMDVAVAAGHLAFPVTYAQATHLKFMWACIKEAMRLYPAVGMPLQRVVPIGGRVIGGRFYPAGTLVGMSLWELHYDSRAYGKDATQWRPERWLEDDRNKLEKYNLVFGQGSRVCLGKNISLMEMSKLLPTLIYHYNVIMQNPEKPWKVSESWFELQYDFFCSVTRRER